MSGPRAQAVQFAGAALAWQRGPHPSCEWPPPRGAAAFPQQIQLSNQLGTFRVLPCVGVGSCAEADTEAIGTPVLSRTLLSEGLVADQAGFSYKIGTG